MSPSTIMSPKNLSTHGNHVSLSTWIFDLCDHTPSTRAFLQKLHGGRLSKTGNDCKQLRRGRTGLRT